MGAFINLADKKFGYLFVLKMGANDNWGLIHWECVCDCGNIITVSGGDLRNGHTKSCGCLRIKSLMCRSITHGKSKERIYKIWAGMIKRCTNRKSKAYKRYGGRGISVCSRWRKFENFYKDMGNAPMEMSLERVKNTGNYDPHNCKWASRIEQANNTRNNRFIEIGSKKMTVAQWAKHFGIPADRIYARLRRGWPISNLFNNSKHKKLKTLIAIGTVWLDQRKIEEI